MSDSRLPLPLASGPIYEDANYKYFGEAEVGTALNVAKWRVSRMDLITKQVTWANLTGTPLQANFDNLYTSLVIVAALIYS